MIEFKTLFLLMILFIAFLNKRLINLKLKIFLLILVSYFIFPVNFKIFSSFLYLDITSASLVFLTFWVVYFMLLTTPSIYKNHKLRKFYYFLLFFFVYIGFYRFFFNNLLIFYIAFERSLIPTFFLIMG